MEPLRLGRMEAAQAIQAAWRAIRARKGGAGLQRVHPRDDEAVPSVSTMDDAAGELLREIGEQTVAQFADTPPSVAGYEAWYRRYVPQYDELTGTDGQEWHVLDES